MSDQSDTATTEDESQDSDLVKNLRAEIKQRDAALNEEREKRTTIERQQAFRDAGVDPKAGPGKLLFEAYDGPAEVDAVKAKAEEYGLDLSAPTPQGEGGTQEEKYTDQERAAQQLIDEAAQGGSPDRLPEDPAQAAHEAFDRELATTGSRDKAMAKSFNARMVAALEAQKKGRR